MTPENTFPQVRTILPGKVGGAGGTRTQKRDASHLRKRHRGGHSHPAASRCIRLGPRQPHCGAVPTAPLRGGPCTCSGRRSARHIYCKAGNPAARPQRMPQTPLPPRPMTGAVTLRIDQEAEAYRYRLPAEHDWCAPWLAPARTPQRPGHASVARESAHGRSAESSPEPNRPAFVRAGGLRPGGRRPARPAPSGGGTRAPSPLAFGTPDTAPPHPGCGP